MAKRQDRRCAPPPLGPRAAATNIPGCRTSRPARACSATSRRSRAIMASPDYRADAANYDLVEIGAYRGRAGRSGRRDALAAGDAEQRPAFPAPSSPASNFTSRTRKELMAEHLSLSERPRRPPDRELARGSALHLHRPRFSDRLRLARTASRCCANTAFPSISRSIRNQMARRGRTCPPQSRYADRLQPYRHAGRSRRGGPGRLARRHEAPCAPSRTSSPRSPASAWSTGRWSEASIRPFVLGVIDYLASTASCSAAISRSTSSIARSIRFTALSRTSLRPSRRARRTSSSTTTRSAIYRL